MEIDRLTSNPDIIAVATLDDDKTIPIIWRHRELDAVDKPSPSWELVMSSALTMFQKVRETVGCGEGYIRVIVGCHTVLVQREQGTSYAVVIVTGHAVAKSLHRTIKRCAKPPTRREAKPCSNL